ncbi:MAG: hypothetical protein C0427_02115 [Rhodobacter sp.]|nr:hypothetical protein [Rhodobacter sp.]
MGEAVDRAHRRAEAVAGFPLLRGCPATAVQRWLARADLLEEAQRLELADELSDLVEAQEAEPMAQEALVARIAARSVLRDVIGIGDAPERWARTIPVKLMARLIEEQGGFEGVARLFQLNGAKAEPPRPHLERWEEAVPVKPVALRKAAVAALVGRFGGEAKTDGELTRITAVLPEGRMVVDLLFAAPGRAVSRQMSHRFFLDRPDGTRVPPGCYETMWRLGAEWDLITERNLDRSMAHLVRVTEARLALIAEG